MSTGSSIDINSSSIGGVALTVEIPWERNGRISHTFHLPEATVRDLIDDLQRALNE